MSTQTKMVIPEWTQGDRLRKARSLSGLTTRELAAKIGVGQKTITDAEGDKRGTRKPVLIAWSLATGVPLEWLETGTYTGGDLGPDGGTFTVSYRQPARVVSLRSSAA